MAKFVQGCKNILNILIFSNLILMAYQKGNLQKNILTRNLEASTSIITDLTTDFSTDLSDIFSTDLFSTTNSTEVTNSTFRYRQAKKSGLSAGGIIGIVAPCVVALGGLGAFVVLSKSNSPILKSNNVPVSYESSMSKFNTQPIINEMNQAVKEVQVIQPTQIVQQQPINQIKQEVPQIVKAEPVTTENELVTVHQIISSENPIVADNNAVGTINATSQIIPENTDS
jgi:hypothetical protein